MDSYARMAKIIQYLDEHFQDQPSLEQLAQLAGLSPTHFHREFQRWIGVSPKDFVQGLTHQYAKGLLQQGSSVLDAALSAGLSGPGRLHDLCLSIEAITPGTIKSQGEGISIHYGSAESPLGPCFFAESDRGICHFEFILNSSQSHKEALQESWPNAILEENPRRAQQLVSQVFRKKPPQGAEKPLKLWLRGSRFRFKVWRALINLEAASLTCYQSLAEQIGQPKAARAVGNAVGANPVAVLIPCHRVIRRSGIVQGYRWGTGRKRALIAWEGATHWKDVPGS